MEDYFEGTIKTINCFRCGKTTKELVGSNDYADTCRECKLRIGKVI